MCIRDRVRIERACCYLEQNYFKTYEIAYKVGFRDEKYFSKAVSYTHLDVYKRQLYNSVLPGNKPSRICFYRNDAVGGMGDTGRYGGLRRPGRYYRALV